MKNDYTIDFYPQSIKFHTGLSKIKNLQDVVAVDQNKLLVIVQALVTDPKIAAEKDKDHYLPLFMNLEFTNTSTQYFKLTTFTALLPDSVYHFKEMRNKRLPIAVESGIDDHKINVFPYITFGIVNIQTHGNCGFSFNWGLTDKKNIYQRFCKLKHDQKSNKYEIQAGDTVIMDDPSKYYFNHEEDAKELFIENYLKTDLDGQAINPKDKKLAVIARKVIDSQTYVFLSFPYNKDNIKKIKL